MTRYRQFCPIARGAEIFAERWTPLILRELLLGGRSFSDIQRGVPRMSRNLLAQRLESLRDSGIVEQVPTNRGHKHLYRLTAAGRALAPVVDALGIWGYNWTSEDFDNEQLDPDHLMWSLHRMLRVDALPREQVVLLFRFRQHASRRYWLVLQRPRVELCLDDPGYQIDLELRATVAAFARLCLGRVTLAHALESGEIDIRGTARCRRAFSSWLGVTRFAALARDPVVSA